MAQAVTFRAFSAETPSFDTTYVVRVISIQSALLVRLRLTILFRAFSAF